MIFKSIFLLLIFVPVFSCTKALPVTENLPKTIKAVKVEEISIQEDINTFGSLMFLKKLDIASPQEGVVEKLFFLEGETCTEGAVMAIIHNPQVELAYMRAEKSKDEAEASLMLAVTRLDDGRLATEARLLGIERSRMELAQAFREYQEMLRKLEDQELLFKEGGIPEESIRVSRFAVETAGEKIRILETDIEARLVGLRDEDLNAAGIIASDDPEEYKRQLVEFSVRGLLAEYSHLLAGKAKAEIELDSARLALGELEIRCPCKAVIAARHIEEGERIRRDGMLFSLMDTSGHYAMATVPEASALKLEKGMAATVTLDASSEIFPAILDLISPSADSRSLSFMIRLRLLENSSSIKPGMFARMRIHTGKEKTALVIPESAIFDDDGENARVFLLTRSLVHISNVELGEIRAEGRIILEGLSSNDVVVDRPDPDLKEGEYVIVAEKI